MAWPAPGKVGKTTFARSLTGAVAGYLNWDVAPAVALLRTLV